MAVIYEIKADGVKVAATPWRPKQADIDKACIAATRRGWNGIFMEVWQNGKLLKEVNPSPEALETE